MLIAFDFDIGHRNWLGAGLGLVESFGTINSFLSRVYRTFIMYYIIQIRRLLIETQDENFTM